ncbi:MAG TPA: carbohydrate ABC transporter permease [Firmicutes bacterium]|nr:carbohydrate ABC transporter permease [Bacillota bacterium]HBT15678.1 carbohydrate ABC transporter permease [Bacillota bacterium]
MNSKLDQILKYIINLFLIVWIGFSIFMFAWFIISSFKSTREIYTSVWGLPKVFRIENYTRVLTDFGLARFLLNSVLTVLTATVLTLALSAPISYVLSKLKFRGSSFITMSFIIGIGIPVQTIFIPLYLMMSKINLTDSLTGLIWLYTVTSLPFTIYLLMGFFKTIPSSLADSAQIDGASAWQSFIKIMLPMARSGILSAGIYIFVMLWKEFELALVFISKEHKQTVSLGLYSLVTKLTYTGDWGGLFASVVLVILPSVVFYILLAKRFIAGLTVGIGKN